MGDRIKVLMFELGKEPFAIEIQNELKPMQDMVGGYIEAVYISRTAVLVCNEEGKLLGLKPNRAVNGDMIVGPFFIAGYGGDEFASISDSDLKKYKTKNGGDSIWLNI